MKLVRAFAAACIVTLCQACQSAVAASLVDAGWLAKNLESPEVLVLDASPRPLHAKGHIPGAVPVDAMAMMSMGVRDMPRGQMDRMYQALGIDAARKVVIYDQGGEWFAPRIFFQLQYDGFPADKLAVLDGGMAKWQAEGLPVSKEPTPAPKPGTFSVASSNEALRSRVPDLFAASGDRSKEVLVDALGPEYHYGAAAFFNKAGHIPNSLLMPAEDLFNPDKTFKSPEEIRRMAAHLGIRPDQEVHSYCGGGGAAAVPYFALKEIAGYPKVRLSVESEMGWMQDDRDLAMWTYATPALMRDGEWLPSWGGRMMRMVGIARLSVIDVRPAEAYARGHVPFAVNVPAETFRANMKDLDALARLLGAAGVDPSHEAVIVSGGGVTRDAALAYVALEKIGQRKVSIFTDSLDSVDALDRMSRKGFAVTKEATVVGRPQKPTDMAVMPVSYAASMRDGVIAAGAKQGAFEPAVFVASGAAVPTRRVPGKVIHVPYTQLLQPDGMPKEAKDIWTVLAKAGVPRYAAIVTFSDDPGEAAANYYVLQLMGFTDVRVLMP